MSRQTSKNCVLSSSFFSPRRRINQPKWLVDLNDLHLKLYRDKRQASREYEEPTRIDYISTLVPSRAFKGETAYFIPVYHSAYAGFLKWFEMRMADDVVDRRLFMFIQHELMTQ